ncbi:BCN_G0016830.mRNA.1.CDS.1 [Saccharomyces cerevisiae]|nr:BCN_G0016830.mRNA.1.CDS.1 [Saccharomyces cerevisiae]CAI7149572.1 BCN_G0016830.mRNA.1.CDS.1 [Saccharomyces cerevisiae]
MSSRCKEYFIVAGVDFICGLDPRNALLKAGISRFKGFGLIFATNKALWQVMFISSQIHQSQKRKSTSETMLFECIGTIAKLPTTKRLFSHHLYRRDRDTAFYPRVSYWWLDFYSTRRLPVLDVRECAYCVISDSAPRKEILACSDFTESHNGK